MGESKDIAKYGPYLFGHTFSADHIQYKVLGYRNYPTLDLYMESSDGKAKWYSDTQVNQLHMKTDATLDKTYNTYGVAFAKNVKVRVNMPDRPIFLIIQDSYFEQFRNRMVHTNKVRPENPEDTSRLFQTYATPDKGKVWTFDMVNQYGNNDKLFIPYQKFDVVSNNNLKRVTDTIRAYSLNPILQPSKEVAEQVKSKETIIIQSAINELAINELYPNGVDADSLKMIKDARREFVLQQWSSMFDAIVADLANRSNRQNLRT